MPDACGVHGHYQQGVLTLTCDPEAFARVTAAVAVAAGPGAAAPAAVDVVVVRRTESPGRPRPWLDALGWAGCGTAAAIVILLLGTGAYTLSRWVWQP